MKCTSYKSDRPFPRIYTQCHRAQHLAVEPGAFQVLHNIPVLKNQYSEKDVSLHFIKTYL